MRKVSKDEYEEPQWEEIEKQRSKRLLQMKQLCDVFDGKSRVSKKVRVNSDTNSLLLVDSVKYGTIVGRVVSLGGLHEMLIIWDGSKVPISEMPYLLEESW
jgi:hypothetical protein